jgi:GT2 family glycosyltransferase
VPADIAVIVATHDRVALARRGLLALQQERAGQAPIEVLLVDSGATLADARALASIAEETGAAYVRLPEPGVSAARNAGAAAACAPWLAFLDDDAVVDPGWLAGLRSAIARYPDAGAIAGAVRPDTAVPIPDWWPSEFRALLSYTRHDAPGRFGTADLPADLEPIGANMVLRAEALAQVGGFDEALGRVGDILLSGEETLVLTAMRQRGWQVWFDPAFAVRHTIADERLTLDWLLRRARWQGVSDAVIEARLGKRLDANWLRWLLRRAHHVVRGRSKDPLWRARAAAARGWFAGWRQIGTTQQPR